MEQGLVAFLKSISALTALVGDRIHPVKLPQAGAFPAVVYTVISGVRNYNQDGQTDLVPYLVQIDCFADRYADCVAMRDAIAGAGGSVNLNYGSPSVCISGFFLNQERDTYEAPLDKSDSGLFRKSLDFNLHAA